METAPEIPSGLVSHIEKQSNKGIHTHTHAHIHTSDTKTHAYLEDDPYEAAHDDGKQHSSSDHNRHQDQILG